MGEGADGDKVKYRKEKEKLEKIKAKLAEDIVKAVVREKFGFPEEKLRAAVNSLIEMFQPAFVILLWLEVLVLPGFQCVENHSLRINHLLLLVA